jgi:hypothetical protein
MGKWSGGAFNRTWGRQGYVPASVPGDDERGERLYAELAAEPFFCEICHGYHPLAEHQQCRSGVPR